MKVLHFEAPMSPQALAAIAVAIANCTGPITIFSGAPPVRATIASVVTRTAYETGVARDVIVGPDKHRPAVRARTAVMWAARTLLNVTFAQIGRALGGRDHSTIQHGVNRGEQWRQDDPSFRRLTDLLVAAFVREAEDFARETRP